MLSVSYYEYKFHVSLEKLAYLRAILEAHYHGSDPFESGIVDSIYFDSTDGRAYEQCAQGEPRKIKYRIRGYGDGTFHQLQRKVKDLSGVSKLKSRIHPVSIINHEAPGWDRLVPVNPHDPAFEKMLGYAAHQGLLIPVVRVKYMRYRYRLNDYRITLDTDIEVMGFNNGWDSVLGHGLIPHHVLEIKTVDPRPHLPFMNLTKLPQISFSKFYLGLNLLRYGSL